MNPRYVVVARRADHGCEYCCAPEAVCNFPFEVEHIFPSSQGGSDELSNLALTCRSCNIYKSAAVTAWDDVTQSDADLFNPRTQSWADHFQLDLDRGEIRGLTPTGRATVAALRMNDPVQIAARLLWIELRLFP